jgi:hypothetical protein
MKRLGELTETRNSYESIIRNSSTANKIIANSHRRIDGYMADSKVSTAANSYNENSIFGCR